MISEKTMTDMLNRFTELSGTNSRDLRVMHGIPVTGSKRQQGLTMTEQVQPIESQNQSVATDSGNTSQAPVQHTETSERTFKQSELNDIIGKVKHDSYQRGLSERQAQQVSQPAYGNQTPQQIQQPSYPANTQNAQQTPAISTEQARQIFAEENAKMLHAQQYERLAQSFVGKIEAGKKQFDDFDTIVTPLNLPQIPAIWQTAEGFENAAAIIYELGTNPGKLGSLLNVAYSPELVKREMQKIADSLKQNELANGKKAPNAPVSRPKPSNIGVSGGDSSALSAQDWKAILKA